MTWTFTDPRLKCEGFTSTMPTLQSVIFGMIHDAAAANVVCVCMDVLMTRFSTQELLSRSLSAMVWYRTFQTSSSTVSVPRTAPFVFTADLLTAPIVICLRDRQCLSRRDCWRQSGSS